MFHKDLEAWKESIKLVKLVYKLTNDFPNQELYGLTSQIRRAVISIPSNIAEGNARATAKETIRFIDIALGSLAELDTQLTIAQELSYIKNYIPHLIIIWLSLTVKKFMFLVHLIKL